MDLDQVRSAHILRVVHGTSFSPLITLRLFLSLAHRLYQLHELGQLACLLRLEIQHLLGGLLIEIWLVHFGTPVTQQETNDRLIELVTGDVQWCVSFAILRRHFAVLPSHQELRQG